MATGTIATQAMPDTRSPGAPSTSEVAVSSRSRRRRSPDRRGRRAQPDQEDADHAQEDRHLRAVEQAAAEDRVEQEEQVEGEQAGQRGAPREDQRHRGQQREDHGDRADAGVVDERRLDQLGEREGGGEHGKRALGIERAPRRVRESRAAHPRGR